MTADERELLEKLRQSRRLLAAGEGTEAKSLLGDLSGYEAPALAGEVHAVRALLHEQEGRLENAVEEWQRAVEARSDDVGAHLGLASALKRLGRFSEASRWLQRATALHPHSPGLREALSETYQEQGLYAEAAGEAEALLRLQPRSPYAHDLLAAAYYHQGKLAEAMRTLARLIRLEPTEPYHHFKLGVVLQQQGELGRAMWEYQRTLDLAPAATLAQIAWEAIQALDSFQIQQVMLRAVEDRLFRHKLSRDPVATLGEYGYHLSEAALESLRWLDWEAYWQASGPRADLIH